MSANYLDGSFVVIVPPSMAFDLASEFDRTGVATIHKEQSGVQKIQVIEWESVQAMDRDRRLVLGALDGLRFKVAEYLAAQEPPQLERLMADRRLHNNDHMAQLRKRTGQDWRGRR